MPSHAYITAVVLRLSSKSDTSIICWHNLLPEPCINVCGPLAAEDTCYLKHTPRPSWCPWHALTLLRAADARASAQGVRFFCYKHAAELVRRRHACALIPLPAPLRVSHNRTAAPRAALGRRVGGERARGPAG
eukprot:3635045-Rhodomonas_salina.1